MTATFDRAFSAIIGVEGGYVNDPADSGGETNWGITVAVAREAGYTGPMRSMPKTEAQRIYKARFWDVLRLDDVAESAPPVALELFEQGVNMGIARAARNLQILLNTLNRAGTDYPDIAVDGHIGAVTLRALHQLIWKRRQEGAVVLAKALNCLQGAFYIDLAARREKDERFVYGWLKERVA